MSVAMWNFHSWPLDVSGNMILIFLTTRCQCWGGGRSTGRSANCHSWPLDVSSNVKLPFWTTRCQYQWGPSANIGLSVKFGVVVFKAPILDSSGGSIGQSRFICQVWCSCFQGIYSQFTRGPSARVGSSAKFCVPVFKASILNSPGGIHWSK